MLLPSYRSCKKQMLQNLHSDAHGGYWFTPSQPSSETPTSPTPRQSGGGTAPTAIHTSDNQVVDHLVKTPAPPLPPPTPPVNDNPLTVHQIIHIKDEVEYQSDAFDLINTNIMTPNQITICLYYLSN